MSGKHFHELQCELNKAEKELKQARRRRDMLWRAVQVAAFGQALTELAAATRGGTRGTS